MELSRDDCHRANKKLIELKFKTDPPPQYGRLGIPPNGRSDRVELDDVGAYSDLLRAMTNKVIDSFARGR